jgi:hypothetical protein
MMEITLGVSGGPANKLTYAQIERLAKLAEECGEVVQMVGKILVHGYESYHPRDEAKTTNRMLLEGEMGNIAQMFDMMIDAGDVSEENINLSAELKKATIGKHLHYN